jgi:hypothetical protein
MSPEALQNYFSDLMYLANFEQGLAQEVRDLIASLPTPAGAL